MVDLDLNTLGYDKKFAAAPVFQKRGTVVATQLRKRERVTTVLADGTEETVNEGQPGDWKVRNPGGEIYVISDETFRQRYERTETSGIYIAKGQVRAFPNDTGRPVTIMASWGEQFGLEDCMFAAKIEQDGTYSQRYLIGRDEFAATYGLVKGSILVIDPRGIFPSAVPERSHASDAVEAPFGNRSTVGRKDRPRT